MLTFSTYFDELYDVFLAKNKKMRRSNTESYTKEKVKEIVKKKKGFKTNKNKLISKALDLSGVALREKMIEVLNKISFRKSTFIISLKYLKEVLIKTNKILNKRSLEK